METLAGAFSLWISAQEVGGSDVQDVAECNEIICFGLACASLIIADRARDDAQLLRKLQLRQPRGLPFQRVALFEGGHLMQDSNLRQPVLETGALPAERIRHEKSAPTRRAKTLAIFGCCQHQSISEMSPAISESE